LRYLDNFTITLEQFPKLLYKQWQPVHYRALTGMNAMQTIIHKAYNTVYWPVTDLSEWPSIPGVLSSVLVIVLVNTVGMSDVPGRTRFVSIVCVVVGLVVVRCWHEGAVPFQVPFSRQVSISLPLITEESPQLNLTIAPGVSEELPVCIVSDPVLAIAGQTVTNNLCLLKRKFLYYTSVINCLAKLIYNLPHFVRNLLLIFVHRLFYCLHFYSISY